LALEALLMAGACDDRTDKDFTRIFYNNVDRLLGMEGRLVRGKSRSRDELFDDDGVLIGWIQRDCQPLQLFSYG